MTNGRPSGRPFAWKHRATALSDTKEEVSL
jgi:hypothetical protein